MALEGRTKKGQPSASGHEYGDRVGGEDSDRDAPDPSEVSRAEAGAYRQGGEDSDRGVANASEAKKTSDPGGYRDGGEVSYRDASSSDAKEAAGAKTGGKKTAKDGDPTRGGEDSDKRSAPADAEMGGKKTAKDGDPTRGGEDSDKRSAPADAGRKTESANPEPAEGLPRGTPSFT